MIGQDRIRPLLLLLAVGGALLVARLYWIQVKEHDVWSVEAARLVHAGHVLPYRRGSITDAHGTVLARDRGSFELALRYRDFRRGHPLAQVAHARSLLEGRAVSLAEAQGNLRTWARDLVTMTSAQLDAFARGKPVECGTWKDPGTAEARDELRALRVADLRFYLSRLLDLTGRPEQSGRMWNEVRKRGQRREPDTPFHVLTAAARSAEGEGKWSAEDVLLDLDARLEQSMEHLDRLARLLVWETDDGVARAGDPLSHLIAEFEDARRLVEDATASKLFLEATGFVPGRLDPALLLGAIDLDWIMYLFAWDEARMAEWANTVRGGWVVGWRNGYALPHLRAELMNPRYERGPDEVLNSIAAIYAPEGAVEQALDRRPVDWRSLDELAVFDALDDIFLAEMPRSVRAARREVLPFQDPVLRQEAAGRPGDWSIIDRTVSHPLAPPPGTAEGEAEASLGARIARLVERGFSRDLDAMYAIFLGVVEEWEATFQTELGRGLEVLRRSADAGRELSPAGKLILREELRERAVERAGHLLKDYGMRPRSLQKRRPDYDVVYLLTRYAEWFPGIEARGTSDRDYPVYAGDGGPLAEKLVGTVSAVTVRQLQAQREEARRLRGLRNTPDKTTTELDEMRRLIGRVLLPDEVRGVAGLEGFFDPELRGTNGYEERRGLQETFQGEGEQLVRAPVDGEDLVLTIELSVQRAAERTLAHPPMVGDDPKFDLEWAANPVGAIVAITADGDVIAAASEPTEHSSLGVEVTGQRTHPVERTLGKPGFQPPGSVFKPFTALYALENGALDPAHEVTCGPLTGRGGCGYKDVRCWSTWGHGVVNLDRALVESCNAYFAWLGESYRDHDFLGLAEAFAFGEHPTGVRTAPPWDDGVSPRLGLTEVLPAVFRGSAPGGNLSDFQRRAAGNGLVVVEVTPMQLVRAYAGLATGVLPELRLARRIGERELPRGPGRTLPFSAANQALVRGALAAVVARPGGTGHGALSPAQLGVAIAAKTGSADITSRDAADDTARRVHKHTWVAGWVPAVDPELVFVIFVHDTMTTSSHGAAYVAQAFLTQPEVRAWLAGRGVELGPVAR